MDIAVFTLDFALCPVLISSIDKVLSCHTATEKVTDANDHSVLNLPRSTIYKKLLPKKEIYVLLEWIFYPDIPVRENIELHSSDYQFLCDCV